MPWTSATLAAVAVSASQLCVVSASMDSVDSDSQPWYSGILDEEDDLVSLVSLAEADTSSNCPQYPQASTNDVGSDVLAQMLSEVLEDTSQIVPMPGFSRC